MLVRKVFCVKYAASNVSSKTSAPVQKGVRLISMKVTHPARFVAINVGFSRILSLI